MLKFFWTIGLLGVLGLTHAQEYAFREYSLKQGLPQSQVKAINQDADGFLWVGTLGGLARFDGRNFDVFTVEDGLLSNRITFIAFVRNTMYVGHENGLSEYLGRGKFKSFAASKIKDNTKLSDLIEFQGKIIVSSNGSGLFQLTEKALEPINHNIADEDLADEFRRIRAMIVYGDKLYFGTRSGLFETSNLNDFQHFSVTEDWSISDLHLFGKEGFYITTYNAGVYEIKPSNASKFNPKLLSIFDCAQIVVEPNQSYWLLTESNEIYRSSKSFRFLFSKTSGLPKEIISTIFVDKNGGLWIGTEGRGLIHFLGKAFTKYSNITAPVLSIERDDSGRLWMGTLNDGLFYFEHGVWQRFKDPQLTENSVWCALEDLSKGMWFGTNAGLLLIQNGKTIWHTTSNNTALPDNKINALHLDANNLIWIGTRKGLAYIKSNMIHRFEPANNPEWLQLIRDVKSKNGDLYVATKTALVRIDWSSRNLSLFTIEGLNPTFSSLEFDHNNNLWIGTEEGLFVLVGDEIKAIDFSEKSADRFVNFIIRRDKKMYVGTNNGLFLFSEFDSNVKEFELRHFAESAGLMSTESNINSAFLDKSGQLWFGTAEGVYSFQKKLLNSALESYKPVLLLKDFQVNFSSMDWPETNKLLTLKYNQNRLRFMFRIVDLQDADGVALEYQLGGSDFNEWLPAGSESEIAFNQLAPGSYTLSVRAKSSNGNYSDVLVFNFKINQPYYATWWFILLMLLLLGLITVGVVRYRIQQIRTKENQERLELTSRLNSLEQQSLNASMNRHFIFNALNSIQYFINTQDKLSANKYLTKFAQLIRKNLDSSAAGENLVPLSEEIQRLELYLSLESMRFEGRFSYHFDIDSEIEMEEIRIPPMLFQPFVENSIIHGILPNEQLEGVIKFKAELHRDTIEFTITDNGVGYSTSLKEKSSSGDHFSHGTSITKSRIEVIRKISGNVIDLEGPKDLLDENQQIVGTIVGIRIQV
jgi:ligand-binding sensor domain-containing protein